MGTTWIVLETTSTGVVEIARTLLWQEVSALLAEDPRRSVESADVWARYETNRRLHALKRASGMTNRELCDLLGMSKTSGGGASNSTLDGWLSLAWPMPRRALRLLELELAARNTSNTP